MRDWFKARNAWGAVILSLSDDEAGKLAKALWAYTMNGQLPACGGYISGLFDMMRITIDQDIMKEAEISNKRAIAGSRGGSQKQANVANAINSLQMSANVANADNKNKKEEKESEKELEKESESFLLDTEAFAIQREHDLILEAAKNAGFKCSPSECADLIHLYADNGLQKMLDGFKACVDHSAPNLAYLRAVLKGEPKKPQGRVLPAQDFQQRDYTGVESELMADLAAEMRKFKEEQTG